MNPQKHRSDAQETALVRYIVIYVLVAWATLVIPLLLGHGVLVAILCVTPIGLAGVWFAAWTIFKQNDLADGEQDQRVPAYDFRKPD